jgi:hypothetical protein
MTDGGGAPRSALFRSAEADSSILCDKQQMMPLYFQVTFELCSPASPAAKQCAIDIFPRAGCATPRCCVYSPPRKRAGAGRTGARREFDDARQNRSGEREHSVSLLHPCAALNLGIKVVTLYLPVEHQLPVRSCCACRPPCRRRIHHGSLDASESRCYFLPRSVHPIIRPLLSRFPQLVGWFRLLPPRCSPARGAAQRGILHRRSRRLPKPRHARHAPPHHASCAALLHN